LGFRFSLRQTNLVAYVTNKTVPPPACRWQDIAGLLNGLRSHALISGDPARRARVRDAADAAERRLKQYQSQTDHLLESDDVSWLLSGVQELLSSFDVYALAVPSVTPSTRGAAEHLALSGREVLVLMPHEHGLKESQPPVGTATLLEFEVAAPASRDRGPGMVIWNRLGTAAFVPAERLYHVVLELLDTLPSPDAGAVDRLLERLGRSGKRRILHLSDLHFGKAEVIRNKPMLDAELHDVVQSVDRVVITGDLFDNPDPNSRAAFQDFRLSLLRICGSPPVIIPGNHDHRWLGNFGQSFAQVAQIPHTAVEADDAARVVFLCLNSSISGRLARGEVTNDQLVAVGAEYRNLLTSRPETHAYLPVVLVHHHPFSFTTPPTIWYQRLLSWIGWNDERFLLMEDAPLFLDWCARWKVSAVLHGHKHQPRYQSDAIQPEGNAAHTVTAIGCGTSLGADGFPLTYNIVYWDDERRLWLAKYYESRGGGPFVPKALTSAQPVALSEPT
jgi:UDP-2,3-diacylglucosamine pyrophosphatase LpxH